MDRVMINCAVGVVVASVVAWLHRWCRGEDEPTPDWDTEEEVVMPRHWTWCESRDLPHPLGVPEHHDGPALEVRKFGPPFLAALPCERVRKVSIRFPPLDEEGALPLGQYRVSWLLAGEDRNSVVTWTGPRSDRSAVLRWVSKMAWHLAPVPVGRPNMMLFQAADTRPWRRRRQN